MSQLKNTTTAPPVQQGRTARIAFSPNYASDLTIEVPGEQCAREALRLSRRLTAGMRGMLLRIGDAINEAGENPSAEEMFALAYMSESATALISAVDRGLGGDA